MTTSRCDDWDRIRELEDLLALLDAAADHALVIRTQAWHEASWRQVFVECTALQEALATVQAELSAWWRRLHAQAQEKP